ncbi:hypothetical protein ACLNGM_06390 [Aureimonas phyllosphaerae]|uniref:hypothetical protein n=1 Tax=Aureimonas phyllosphaerae TaxID=1166078 RepID=UPI003A5C5924
MGLKRTTIQGFRRKGMIPYIPGVPALFDRKDVDAFIAQRKAAKEAKRAERLREPTPEEQHEAWVQKMRFKLWLQAEKARKRDSEKAK